METSEQLLLMPFYEELCKTCYFAIVYEIYGMFWYRGN